ncbi:glycerol kinase GlpK [Halotalea alkalilenta]|uniref:glycerol kinase GlpK n=1 Tax=Halotalea alkalilenta TaxID=376489 RepID=UPI0004849687|nr:glycerol kinase GlpK [Halotalea alkalilenta]
MTDHILAIDQGTTSTRAVLFDRRAKVVAMAQEELPQHFPHNGWVEHHPQDIWQSTVRTITQALRNAGKTIHSLAGIGITNQRETTMVWDARTGEPIHRAIVWQDRRTSEACKALSEAGHEELIRSRTGLLIDPYFSATKLQWLLDHVEGARERAKRGELLFGTIDSYLIWKLTGGKRHVTDATNASRTCLFDIHRQCWDDDLLELFDVPRVMLPEVLDSSGEFGWLDPQLFGASVKIAGVAGDQQAALVGQACFSPGMVKSTYGTGCFMIMNTGERAERSANRLLTTVGYRLNGVPTYAMEGSIFVAGAAVQWMRDGLKLFSDASETERLARASDAEHGVYLVPAFTGLGAPYWDPLARGAIFGLTRSTGISEIVAAGLQSVCYQTRDLQACMDDDAASRAQALRVDGGMVCNDWVMQFLADILDLRVDRPEVLETTALGAAYLAALELGWFSSLDEISALWRRERCFTPNMESAHREQLYAGWRDAVRRVMS